MNTITLESTITCPNCREETQCPNCREDLTQEEVKKAWENNEKEIFGP